MTWPPDPQSYEPGPYAPMALGYDDDPKVVALVRFGDDAGLCRDLHLAMIRYANRARTDGKVPAIEIRRLAFPLAAEHAERLARYLGEEELIGPLDSDGKALAMADVIAGAIPSAWRVISYEKWNRLRDWIDHRHTQNVHAGTLGAQRRWSRDRAKRTGSTGHSAGNSTELIHELKTSGARAGAGAREDDADGWTPHDALDAQPAKRTRPQPPPSSQVLATRYSPSDDPAARAAEARQALAERQRVAGVRVALDEGQALTDASRLHDQDLARAQLAEARAARIPDVPDRKPEPGDDDWQPPF